MATYKAKGWAAKFFILGCILMLAGVVWAFYNSIDTWDVLLTNKDKFLLNWKPVLVLVAGFVIMSVSLKRIK